MFTSSKANLLITVAALVFCLALTVGVGWWSWRQYRQLNQPGTDKPQPVKIELDVESLNKALELSK